MTKCFICTQNTKYKICEDCRADLEYLGMEIPDATATDEEFKQWAKANEITFFSCENASGEKP
jgi:hypothetical protein